MESVEEPTTTSLIAIQVKKVKKVARASLVVTTRGVARKCAPQGGVWAPKYPVLRVLSVTTVSTRHLAPVQLDGDETMILREPHGGRPHKELKGSPTTGPAGRGNPMPDLGLALPS